MHRVARHFAPRAWLVGLACFAVLASCQEAGNGNEPGSFGVSLTSPSSTAYVRDDVTIQVSVTGQVDAVELHRDGVLLVVLTPPYTYLWDTRSEPEGSYELTAVARQGTASKASEARTIVVDRTRPHVTSRTPSPGQEQVWVGDPIEVTFSERIDASTLSPAAVTLERVGGTVVDVTVELSNDGRVANVQPDLVPTAPAVLQLSLADAITDLAGNPLLAPDPWSWSLPVWQRLGAPLNVDPNIRAHVPRIALDHDEHPVVIWREDDADSTPPVDLYVKRWDGEAWVQLGSSLSDDPDRFGPMYGVPDIAVDGTGAPIVAWTQPVRGLGHVQRWDGTAWQGLGGGYNVDPDAPTYRVVMALDADDRPWIAWSEGNGSDRNVYVARWTGEDWALVGDARDRTGHDVLGWPVLAFDAMQRPLVAWSQAVDADRETYDVFVDRWNGTSWEALGSGFTSAVDEDALSPRLAVADDASVYLSFIDARSSTRLLNVRTWDPSAGAWSFVDAIGGKSKPEVRYGTVAIGAEGQPVVAWVEEREDPDGPTSTYHVRAWDGFAFRQVGAPIDAYEPFLWSLDLATTEQGVPLLATPLRDDTGRRGQLVVSRLNVLP
ncbi:MAG: Ig-like domain-containing protein [Trueperaceae bacterium]|nr:Ig-like domain-containing protein [Trueperaceae bacterium]